MPKKFKGENSKAVEARERKMERKYAEEAKKKQQEEDKLWEDNDKHAGRKQQRKVRYSYIFLFFIFIFERIGNAISCPRSVPTLRDRLYRYVL